MNLAFPDFKVEWKKNTVIWTGSLQPTSLSKGYTVEIAYSLDMQQPEVIVLNPSLQKRGKEKSRMFIRNKLCLFRPKRKNGRSKCSF